MNLQAIYDRITERREAVGLSESAAAKRAGLSADAIRNIRRALKEGKEGAGISTRTLAALAPVLETTAEWLMTQQGEKVAIAPPPSDVVPAATRHAPESMARDLPVYGSARGSLVDGVEGIEIFSTTAVDYVRRPSVLVNVPGAYAVYVSGDSMDPAHPNGALRLVHPHRPVSPGDTVIVQTRHYDGAPPQGYIKVLRRRAGERLILEQYNPAAKIEIPVKYVVSVHKVLDMNDLYG